MITLNSQIAQELGLTYWQKPECNTAIIYQLNHDEKELLRKILQAKAVKLSDDMIVVDKDNVVRVTTKTHQLVFNDVNQPDSKNIVNLANLSDMLKDKEQKKLTWLKLKNLNFY
jgi:pyoverdine/dityrosine biosynthesis protein Dit1